MTNNDIRDYCSNVYADAYLKAKEKIENDIRVESKNGTVPLTRVSEVETAAQKEAIKLATIEGIKHFPMWRRL